MNSQTPNLKLRTLNFSCNLVTKHLQIGTIFPHKRRKRGISLLIYFFDISNILFRNFIVCVVLGLMISSCGITKRLENRQHKNRNERFNDSLQTVGSLPSGVPSPSKRVYKDIQRSSHKSAQAMAARHPNLAAVPIENINLLNFKYAILLDVPIEALANLSLLQYMEEWYHTPYRYGGASKDGVDCSAFTAGIITAVYGLAIPRTVREQYQTTERIDKEELIEGDLVFFNTTGSISHVGVYIFNNKFVHASTTSGVMVSDLNDNYFMRRYAGAGRLK